MSGRNRTDQIVRCPIIIIISPIIDCQNYKLGNKSYLLNRISFVFFNRGNIFLATLEKIIRLFSL